LLNVINNIAYNLLPHFIY